MVDVNSKDAGTVGGASTKKMTGNGKLRSFIRRFSTGSVSDGNASTGNVSDENASVGRRTCSCTPVKLALETTEEVEEAIADVTEDQPGRLVRVGRVSMQIVRLLSKFLGVIGGVYAVLRLYGCEFVHDEFEIFVRRK